MLPEEKKNLSNMRLEHAKQCLKTAKSIIKYEADYKSAANRSYYAIFHAMRSVLALDGIDNKKHSGIIAEFRRLYIKTGIFEDSLSEIISMLFKIRNDSDYDDFYLIDKVKVEEQIRNAEHFLSEIEKYLVSKSVILS